jgi:HAD superfamily hydrolase (TIGR01549 family)
VTPPIEAVVFDLDGTLCERRRAGGEVLAAAFEEVGVEPLFTLDEYHAKIDVIGDTGSDVRRRVRCFEALIEEHGRDSTLGSAIADAYEAERDYSDVRFRAGAECALTALDERYPLALVTNGGPDTQNEKIAALDIGPYFETIVLAGHETAAKPDPEPFAVTLDTLNVQPANTVYIGNSFEHDIVGAHAAGMQACLVSDEAVDPSDVNETPEYVFDSLAEYEILL